MAGEYDDRQCDFDDRITVENADGTQSAFQILVAEGYTGPPVAKQFIMMADGDLRCGRNAAVDATHGAVLAAATPLTLYSLDLRAFKIYADVDSIVDFFVTGR